MIEAGEFRMDSFDLNLNPRNSRRRRRGGTGTAEIPHIYGNSVKHEFVPVFSMDGQNIQTRIGKDFLHTFPSQDSGQTCSSYNSMFGILNNQNSFYNYYFAYQEESGVIKVHRGLMLDEHDNVLYLLCMRKTVDGVMHAKPGDLRAYISNKLLGDKYLNLFRKFTKDYFNPMISEGVEIIYTSDDIKSMFYEKQIQMSFSNLGEMKDQLNEAKGLLRFDISYELMEIAQKKGLMTNGGRVVPPQEVMVLNPADQDLYTYLYDFVGAPLYLQETEIDSWFLMEPIAVPEPEPLEENARAIGDSSGDDWDSVEGEDSGDYEMREDYDLEEVPMEAQAIESDQPRPLEETFTISGTSSIIPEGTYTLAPSNDGSVSVSQTDSTSSITIIDDTEPTSDSADVPF